MSQDYPALCDQELSESDDTQTVDQVAADITELYRRQQQARAIPAGYYHSQVPENYYTHGRNCLCNSTASADDSKHYYYKTCRTRSKQQQLETNREELLPNSNQLLTCQDMRNIGNVNGSRKKYPVTYRTARYYRGPTGPTLCKRSSILCLPVTRQPDPAVYHSHIRKTSTLPPPLRTEIFHYPGNQEIASTHTGTDYMIKTSTPSPPHLSTIPKLVDSQGDINVRIEEWEKLLTRYGDNNNNEDVEIGTVSDISKILKPKIPASLKAKETAKLLKLGATDATTSGNFDLTSENMHKVEIKQTPDDYCFDKKIIDAIEKKRLISEQKSLDDNSALELHKSKSYIVSLIDKALSKELGTIPGDKCTTSEFLAMSPKRAIALVNRHRGSKIGSSDAIKTETKESQTIISKSDEPLYLKQLKQLRWRHLRHIQREAKRLVDLEQFLDSFSEESSSH